MKLPRVRISTLMLLVLVAALAIALVVEKRRSARLIAELQGAQTRDEVDRILLRIKVAEMEAEVRTTQSQEIRRRITDEKP